jgi:hypothetical protein
LPAFKAGGGWRFNLESIDQRLSGAERTSECRTGGQTA